MFLLLYLVAHQKDPSHMLLLIGYHAASKLHSSRLTRQALKRIFLKPKVPEKVKNHLLRRGSITDVRWRDRTLQLCILACAESHR